MCLISMMISFGVIALVGGGAGYFIANGKLNDASWLWKKYGSDDYQAMVRLKDIGLYAIIIGILLIVVGIILYAVNSSREKSQKTNIYYVQQQRPVQNATRFCCHCGNPLPTDGKFCPSCGSENETVQRQCSCGTVLEDGAVFCPNCGQKYQE